MTKKSTTETIVESMGLLDRRLDRLEKPAATPAEALEQRIHETSGERRALLSMMPRRKSWPELAALHQRVEELQRREADAAARAAAMTAEIEAAERRDQRALADWVANGGRGTRPEPAAPAVREELDRALAEQNATDIAVADALARKEDFVARHRVHLRKRPLPRRDRAGRGRSRRLRAGREYEPGQGHIRRAGVRIRRMVDRDGRLGRIPAAAPEA